MSRMFSWRFFFLFSYFFVRGGHLTDDIPTNRRSHYDSHRSIVMDAHSLCKGRSGDNYRRCGHSLWLFKCLKFRGSFILPCLAGWSRNGCSQPLNRAIMTLSLYIRTRFCHQTRSNWYGEYFSNDEPPPLANAKNSVNNLGFDMRVHKYRMALPSLKNGQHPNVCILLWISETAHCSNTLALKKGNE